MPEEFEQEQFAALQMSLPDEPDAHMEARYSEEDKAQLALAAKAIRLDIVKWTDGYMDCGYHSERYGQPGLVVLVNGLEELWNPLTDDGDALRLAVKLNMLVEHPGLTWQLMQEFPGDEYEQTRRAIVRAAAEIGANMQS